MWRARGLALAAVLGVPLSGPAAGATLNVDEIEKADFSGATLPADRVTPLAIKLPVLLAGSGFSLGKIDGHYGENAQKALRAFADASGLGGRQSTPELWRKFTAPAALPILVRYKMSARGLEGPLVRKILSKLEANRSETAKSCKRRAMRTARRDDAHGDSVAGRRPAQLPCAAQSRPQFQRGYRQRRLSLSFAHAALPPSLHRVIHDRCAALDP